MDADAFPQEILTDDEPRCLRRQKPLEIKRRKLGRKVSSGYLRALLGMLFSLAAAWMGYHAARFLFSSPEMALLHPDQVRLSGIHFVTRESVLEIFAADRGHSVLKIPLEERRRQLGAIPWVENAQVRRALPNQVQVEVTERTPVAFLREGSELGLVDSHGVILERPVAANFHFPVVTGIGSEMSPEARERRMQMYSSFAQQVEVARAGAMEQVSEVEVADSDDLRATLVDLPGVGGARGRTAAPLLVRFGDGDYESKYRMLVENIAEWRAAAGRVESVDLRFNREAVVNPGAATPARPGAPVMKPPVSSSAATARGRAKGATKRAGR